MTNPKKLPSVKSGDRAIIVGRTGSGKSTLANWLLQRSNQHWLIVNPKGTASYAKLPDSIVVKDLGVAAFKRAITRYKYVIFEPQNSADSSVENMDGLIEWLQSNYENVGLCADELYTLHGGNANAKSGLIGWLTRGRELKQSFIGLTQRPRFISQFLFSEAEYIASLDLALENDRKRMVEVTGQFDFDSRMKAQHWLWYDVGKDHLRRFGPVPMP